MSSLFVLSHVNEKNCRVLCYTRNHDYILEALDDYSILIFNQLTKTRPWVSPSKELVSKKLKYILNHVNDERWHWHDIDVEMNESKEDYINNRCHLDEYDTPVDDETPLDTLLKNTYHMRFIRNSKTVDSLYDVSQLSRVDADAHRINIYYIDRDGKVRVEHTFTVDVVDQYVKEALQEETELSREFKSSIIEWEDIVKQPPDVIYDDDDFKRGGGGYDSDDSACTASPDVEVDGETMYDD